MLDTSRRVTELTLELENENSRVAEMQAEFDRIATWSEIFDSSDIATKKMICGYIIKRVTVYRDYKLDVEFNITVKQFLNSIDSVELKDSCMVTSIPSKSFCKLNFFIRFRLLTVCGQYSGFSPW